MTYVDVGFHVCTVAIVYETDHLLEVVQQAESERLELEGDLDSLLGSVVGEGLGVLDSPSPLGFGRNDFPLPDILAEDEQDGCLP